MPLDGEYAPSSWEWVRTRSSCTRALAAPKAPTLLDSYP